MSAATEHKVTLRATSKQQEWFAAVWSGRYRYMATGGAIRGTKTFMTLMTLFALAWKFPRSRWTITRKDGQTLKRNTVPSIEKLRDTTTGISDLNQSKGEYTFSNGSKILLLPELIDEDPDLDRFKGFETNGFLLEESQECAARTNQKCIERAGSWIVPPDQKQLRAIEQAVKRGYSEQDAFRIFGPKQPPPFLFYTFNPTDEWPREMFYEPFNQGTLAAPYYYLPTTIFDNPYVTQDYLDSLKTLEPEDYSRFVLGKWGKVQSPNQLISSDMLVACYDVPHVEGPMREGCDVGRYGDDPSVFCRIDGNSLDEFETLEQWDVQQVANRAEERRTQFGIGAAYYTIDTVGVGGGVADIMKGNGFKVNEFEAGKAGGYPRKLPSGQLSLYTYKDARSQAFWEFREAVRLRQIRINVRHKQFVKEITAIRYSINNRVIAIEPKEDTKERLRSSPDHADAAVMAWFEFPRVEHAWVQPSVGSKALSRLRNSGNRRASRRGRFG